MYNQECELYGLHQHKFTNEQYYEKFNTRFDVGEDIGITRQHRLIMEYTAQETILNFLMTSVQMKNGGRKVYRGKVSLVYFLRKSVNQHNKLRVDFQNYFTIGDDRYPKNIQGNLIILAKYTKSSVSQQTTP